MAPACAPGRTPSARRWAMLVEVALLEIAARRGIAHDPDLVSLGGMSFDKIAARAGRSRPGRPKAMDDAEAVWWTPVRTTVREQRRYRRAAPGRRSERARS